MTILIFNWQGLLKSTCFGQNFDFAHAKQQKSRSMKMFFCREQLFKISIKNQILNKTSSWQSRLCLAATLTTFVFKVDPSLIQITASEDEVEARIEAFIARKRKELDSSNIREFCGRSASDDSSGFSCARTDSVVVRRTGSRFAHCPNCFPDS